MADILPPPDGLDLREIASEAGLLAAIEREAAKLEVAKKEKRRLQRDEIRLISFLAGEVRRRVESLTPEQKEEFARIRKDAEYKELEDRVRELKGDVTAFTRIAEGGPGEFRFSYVSELEMRIRAMSMNLEADPETCAPLMTTLADLTRQLKDVKSRGSLFGGLKSFG